MINQESVERKDKLQIGDVVHLKSGSPDLEVIALSGNEDYVAVRWQQLSGEAYAVFAITSVRPTR